MSLETQQTQRRLGENEPLLSITVMTSDGLTDSFTVSNSDLVIKDSYLAVCIRKATDPKDYQTVMIPWAHISRVIIGFAPVDEEKKDAETKE